MRLLLTISGTGDRVIEAGPSTTVAQIEAAIDPTARAPQPVGAAGPGRAPTVGRTLRVERNGAVLHPAGVLSEMDVRCGDRITVVDIDDDTVLDQGIDPSVQPSASVRMLTGPLAGKTFILGQGATRVGRASRNDLVVPDPGLSRHHAILRVEPSAVVVSDLGATNGVRIESRAIEEPTALQPGQRVLFGQSWAAVDHYPVPFAPSDGRVFFDRPQRLAAPYQGRTFRVPAPPDLGASDRQRNLSTRMVQRRVVDTYDEAVDRVMAGLASARRDERESRLEDAPSVDDILLGVLARTRLWERRTSDPDVLQVRLGLAELPSRHRIELEPGGDPMLRARVEKLPKTYATIDGVPATVDLSNPGGLTLQGDRQHLRPVAASLVAQLVALNPPEQVGVVLFGDAVAEWDWLKWLPHADLCGDGRPPTGDQTVDLLADLLDSVGGSDRRRPPRPAHIIVVVDDSTLLGRTAESPTGGPSALVRLLARGTDKGLHPLVLADDSQHIPVVASGLFGAVMTAEGWVGRLKLRDEEEQVVESIALEPTSEEAASELARVLAPLVIRAGVANRSRRRVVNGSVPADADPVVSPLRLGPDPDDVAESDADQTSDRSSDSDPASTTDRSSDPDPDPTTVESSGSGSAGSAASGSGSGSAGSAASGSAESPGSGSASVESSKPAGPSGAARAEPSPVAGSPGSAPVPDRAPSPGPAATAAATQAGAQRPEPARAPSSASAPMPAPATAQAPALAPAPAPARAGAQPPTPAATASPVQDVARSTGPAVASAPVSASKTPAPPAAASARAPTEPPAARADRPPGAAPDLLGLPRSSDDSRLVLGVFRMPGQSVDTVLAFNPPRDGTLGLIGPADAGSSGCLATVAAATVRTDGPVDRRPVLYGFGPSGGLEPLSSLRNLRGLAGDDPSRGMELLIEVEQLMGDRMLTFELAGVDTFDAYRKARPEADLRRAVVLVDGLGRLASLLEPEHPGRTREVIGQLLEIGSGLGVHLVFSVEGRREVDPLLVPKVGRWLPIGSGPNGPGQVMVDGAEVRFAIPGGSWRPDDVAQAMDRLAATEG